MDCQSKFIFDFSDREIASSQNLSLWQALLIALGGHAAMRISSMGSRVLMSRSKMP